MKIAQPLRQEWFSAEKLAEMRLPGMPSTKAGMLMRASSEGWRHPETQGLKWRPKQGKGGGIEYHYSVLPTECMPRLLAIYGLRTEPAVDEKPKVRFRRSEAWSFFEKLRDDQREVARARLGALQMVEKMIATGTSRQLSIAHVAIENDVSPNTIRNWFIAVRGIEQADWLPFLAPRHVGRTETVECTPDAWDWLQADYLRLEQPTMASCYARLVKVAAKEGWTIPSERTLQRRIDALAERVKVKLRRGEEALKRLYPAQERDRGVFHALEAVNADGHKWDVFVRWADGTIGRPMMVAFQDLYSGLILSHRIQRSENKESVRLAFGDLVERFGIPSDCWLDNGRGFASKWITGGTPTRYRFKVKDEDPAGILTALGVKVHWATPYHGQAKPIERAFGDLESRVGKDPRFAGAYVGNNPMAKPENYGSKAIDIAVFEQVVAEGIIEHNTRTGRRSKVCAGRSFLEAFTESYEKAPIKKATPEQRRLWLLAAEAVPAGRVDGAMELLGNRYWAPFLHEHRGHKLVARFDPQALKQDLQVYRLDGSYLGPAPCIEAKGFNDVDAARQHAANRGAWVKASRDAAKAVKKMSLSEAAALLPQAEETEPPESKVVRPMFPTRGNAALKPVAQEEGEESPHEAALFDALRQMRRPVAGQPHLRAVTDED